LEKGNSWGGVRIAISCGQFVWVGGIRGFGTGGGVWGGERKGGRFKGNGRKRKFLTTKVGGDKSDEKKEGGFKRVSPH